MGTTGNPVLYQSALADATSTVRSPLLKGGGPRVRGDLVIEPCRELVGVTGAQLIQRSNTT